MTYATDGVRLLEVIDNVKNYGLLGGEYVIARDASRPVEPDEDERLITVPRTRRSTHTHRGVSGCSLVTTWRGFTHSQQGGIMKDPDGFRIESLNTDVSDLLDCSDVDAEFTDIALAANDAMIDVFSTDQAHEEALIELALAS